MTPMGRGLTPLLGKAGRTEFNPAASLASASLFARLFLHGDVHCVSDANRLVAPLAQLDRASVYGTEGFWFEPRGVYCNWTHVFERFLLGNMGLFVSNKAGGARPHLCNHVFHPSLLI